MSEGVVVSRGGRWRRIAGVAAGAAVLVVGSWSVAQSRFWDPLHAGMSERRILEVVERAAPVGTAASEVATRLKGLGLEVGGPYPRDGTEKEWPKGTRRLRAILRPKGLQRLARVDRAVQIQIDLGAQDRVAGFATREVFTGP